MEDRARSLRRTTVASLAIGVIALVGCTDDDTAEPADTTVMTTTSAAPTATDAPPTTSEPDDVAVRLPGAPYLASPDADLELRVVVGVDSAEEAAFDPAADQVTVPGPDGELVYLLGPVELDGSIVDRTSTLFDDLNGWSVTIDMTPEGGAAFDGLAASIVGEQLAIVSGGVVWSAPTVQQSNFGGMALITGDFEQADADRLARLVAGAG